MPVQTAIKIRRSSVASKIPLTTDLVLGELALNTTDGALYFKKSPSGVDSIVAVATLDGTQTLTNKTLSSTTLTGTLTAGGGVGTNGQVLQSTATGVQWATIAGSGGTTTNALTIGTGLSGTSFNGSTAVTIAIDSTVVTLTGSQTLKNKTLSSATITGTVTAGGAVGTAGQVLSSTGTGVQWVAASAGGGLSVDESIIYSMIF